MDEDAASVGEDDSSVEHIEDPFPFNIVAQRTDEFLIAHGLVEVDSLDQIGTTTNISGDGNCGYRASRKGLIVNGNRLVFEGLNGIREEQHHHLLTHMTEFRHLLYQHLSRNYENFNSGGAALDAELETLPDFRGSRRTVMSEVGGTIWERGVDFDRGCDSSYWFDVHFDLPIVAHKYRTHLVSYSTTPQGNGLANKSTHIGYYDHVMDRVVLYYVPGRYITPLANAVCLVHRGNHFDLLIARKTLDEMFKTVNYWGNHLGGLHDMKNREAALEAMARPNVRPRDHTSTSTDASSGITAACVETVGKGTIGNGSCNDPLVCMLDEAVQEVSYCLPIDSASYFFREVEIEGRMYDEYVEMDRSKKFIVEIDHSELFGKINVVKDNAGDVVRVDIAEEFTGRGDWFKDKMREHVPDHIVLRAQNWKRCTLPAERKVKGRQGRHANHDYIIYFDGWWWCAGSNRVGARGRGNSVDDFESRCSTKYYGGITLEQLQRFANAKHDIKIKLQIEFAGRCIHRHGDDFGVLRGRARKRKMEEVRTD